MPPSAGNPSSSSSCIERPTSATRRFLLVPSTYPLPSVLRTVRIVHRPPSLPQAHHSRSESASVAPSLQRKMLLRSGPGSHCDRHIRVAQRDTLSHPRQVHWSHRLSEHRRCRTKSEVPTDGPTAAPRSGLHTAVVCDSCSAHPYSHSRSVWAGPSDSHPPGGEHVVVCGALEREVRDVLEVQQASWICWNPSRMLRCFERHERLLNDFYLFLSSILVCLGVQNPA